MKENIWEKFFSWNGVNYRITCDQSDMDELYVYLYREGEKEAVLDFTLYDGFYVSEEFFDEINEVLEDMKEGLEDFDRLINLFKDWYNHMEDLVFDPGWRGPGGSWDEDVKVRI